MSQMSNQSSGSTIDEKVVAMRFDNRQFEKGVQSTLRYCDELNKGLKFEGASKGLERVAKASENLDMSKFEKSVDAVRVKIGALETMAITSISRMTNALIDFGKKTLDTFAIQPVTTGFNEYELKMGSIQTIMAATGEKLGVVNKYLEELNEYSDRTIYSFSDMTQNIGKFTNAGVKLEDAVAAIKGISNEAALSGANANEASRAMYNFSQALSAGYVKLMDWKSIELANMATASFKEELLNTAAEVGTVSKNAEGMYNVLTKNANGSSMNEAISATKNFNESLNDQWLTTEVLTKTLAKYADEQTDIGKRAYAAAQDVKTFSMMVDTLTESAQSGWAKTWELIIGDFEQGKTLFTELTKFFDGVLSRSADARNELIENAMKLQNGEGLSGRDAFWQSLLNILEHLRKVMGSVKDAWEDIFPPVTSQKLRSIIESLYQFSKGLDSSDEKLQKIRQTFRGIFAILDMFITIIRFTFRVATKLVEGFVNILTVLLFGGFQLLLNWIEKIRRTTPAFDSWVNSIGDGIKKFIDDISNLNGINFDNILNSIKSFGDNIGEKIFNFDGVKKVFGRFQKDTSNMVKKSSLDVKGSFGLDTMQMKAERVRKDNNLVKVFQDVGISSEISSEKAKKSLDSLISFLSKMKEKAVDVMGSLNESLNLKDISFGQILAGVIGVQLLLIINSIRKLVGAMANVLTNLSAVFNGLRWITVRVEEILQSVSSSIKKTARAFSAKMYSEAFVNIAKSIAILTGSLAVLTLLDTDKMYEALKVLGLLAAGFIAIAIASSKFGKDKDSIAFAAIIISMAASIKLLAQTLSLLNDMGGSNLSKPLLALVGLSTVMVLIARTMGSKNKKYYAGVLSMVGFAIGLRTLVGVLASITKMDLTGISKGFKVLYGLTGVLALVGLGFKNVKLGGALAVLAFVPGIKMLITALAELSKMDTTQVESSLKLITKIFGMFALLMIAASIANRHMESFEVTTDKSKKTGTKSADNVKQLGQTFLKIAASLLVIVGAFKLFGMLSYEEIIKAQTIIGKIMLVFAALVAVSHFAGENASIAGAMILKMSVAIGLLSGVMMLLSMFKDGEQLKTPVKVISQLMVVMGLVIALTGLASKNKDTSAVIGKLMTTMIALSVMVATMSLIKPERLDGAAKAISMVMGTFALLVAITKDTGKLSGSVTGLAVIAVSLGALLGIMSSFNLSGVLENAAGISILLGSLSASFFVLSKSDALSKGVLPQLLGLVAIMSALALVVGVLEKFNLGTSIPNAAGIGILLGFLSVSFGILSKTDALSKGVLGQLAIMGAIMSALALVVGLLEKNNLGTSIQNAAAIGILLLSLSASFSLITGDNSVSWKTIGQIAIMSAIMGGLGALVGWLEKNDLTVSIENALAMSVLLLGVSAACGVASIVGKAGSSAMMGIAAIMLFIAAFGALMLGIGQLRKVSPNIMDDLDFAIEFLRKLGEGIGSFVGGIVAGFEVSVLEGLGDGLAAFGESIVPFLDVCRSIEPQTLENIKGLAAALLSITASELLDAVAGWLTGGNSLSDFGDQLVGLGGTLVSFSVVTKEIQNGQHVDDAIDVLRKLANVAKEIPNTGGLLGAIVGNNDMDRFAEQLPIMASGIVSFCYKTKNIDYGPHIEHAVDAIGKLAKVAQDIPNTGGLLGDLIGNNDMEDFAVQLPVMANGIVSFCYKTKNIDYGPHIQQACDAIESLAKVAQDIPNTGGLLGDLVGNNDFDEFGRQLPALGLGLVTFCNTIDGIKTGSVDDATEAAKKIAIFSKDISNSGGMWQDVFGEVDISEFGRQITWLGKYLWIYSTWIDQISDFKKFEDSIDAVKTLSEIATIVDNTNTKDMGKFSSAMVNFAETGLTEFSRVMNEADVKTIGTTLGTKITDAIKKTRTKFVSAAKWVVDGFLFGITTKFKGINGVQSKGTELASTFLESIKTEFDVKQGSSRKMEEVGKNVLNGFTNGITNGTTTVTSAADTLTNDFQREVEKELEIHSPSKWGEWVGNMTTSGMGNGIAEGASSLLGNFGGIWESMKGLSSDGISSIKDIVGNNSLWDFTAPVGDNLVTAKDKLKEWLGFGGEGGLSDLFGFGSLSDELEKEIEGSYTGVQSGMGGLANKISSGDGGAASNLSEALKIAMHKHFDSAEFIFLGKQIGEKMAIAANNAIVSKAKALGKTFPEVVAATAGGLDAWKAWAEDRKAYNKLSVKDELAGWTLVQKMYEEGSKERMEADKEVYNLQKELVKGTFEYSKQWIDNEKYYNRLTLEQELAAWERIQKRYLEGSEERIEADKEVYRVREELRQRDYENAKKWIEKEKKFDRLSLADELAAYKRIRETTKENSDERAEMEEQIYDLEKEIYEAQQTYIENVTAAQEDANQQRINLEQEYADKVKEIEEKLAGDIQSLNEKYTESVKQRTQTLYQAYGLFDAVKETEYDKEELMANLKDQVYALDNWRTDIKRLSTRGLDTALIDELTEMGPSAAGQIKALNEMTDSELSQYNLLWSQKSAMAREQAISELEDLRIETSENISQLQVDSAKELDEYRQTWSDAMTQVTKDCAEKLASLRKEFGENVGLIKKDTEIKMREMTETANKILLAAGWDNTGKQIVNGVVNGIQSNRSTLLDTITKLGLDAVKALNKSLEVHSPSRATYRSGLFAGQGLVDGLNAYDDRVRMAGAKWGDELQNGTYEVIGRIYSLLENGMEVNPRIIPVIDFTNAQRSLDEFNGSIDISRATRLATDSNIRLEESRKMEFVNPNDDVVKELKDLRSDVGVLGDKVSKMQIIMDTGAVVGEITTPLDTALGDRVTRNRRERG